MIYKLNYRHSISTFFKCKFYFSYGSIQCIYVFVLDNANWVWNEKKMQLKKSKNNRYLLIIYQLVLTTTIKQRVVAPTTKYLFLKGETLSYPATVWIESESNNNILCVTPQCWLSRIHFRLGRWIKHGKEYGHPSWQYHP